MKDRVKYTLKIADIYFAVDSYPDSYTREIFEPYLAEDIRGDCDVVAVSCTKVGEALSVPGYTKLTDKVSNDWYSDGSGRYTMCFKDPDEGFVCARMDYDNNTATAALQLVDISKINGEDDIYFLANVMEYLFRLVLVFRGGFIVHASSIAHEGFGVAFSALSGTGKSTHTALWQKVYPGTDIINDDGPALRPKDGIWYIYGTPWAGTSGINKNISLPLKALVFLERSEDNTIRTMSALESIKRLFEAIIHPVSDELMSLVLESVSSFITNSTLCVLGCNMTDDAPKTVKEYLYK